jgi:hypothetical protein
MLAGAAARAAVLPPAQLAAASTTSASPTGVTSALACAISQPSPAAARASAAAW